jgi:hypothetical protein
MIVEEMADAFEKIDIFRTVIAPSAAALHRPDLQEARLPEPQDVLRQIKIIRNFADRAKGIGALVHRHTPNAASNMKAFPRTTHHISTVCRKKFKSHLELFHSETTDTPPERQRKGPISADLDI